MEIEARCQRGLSVVLIPCPFQGHLTPMLQLGSILHSRGFSVIVAHTQLDAPNVSNHPEFVFLAMNDGIVGLCNMPFSSMILNLYDMNENCKAPLRDYLVKMIEKELVDHGGDKLACIIYDNNMFFVDSVASQLKLPTIVMRPFNAAYLHSVLTILQQPDKYFPFEESRLLEPLPELHPLRYKDVPFPVINNTVEEHILQFRRLTNDIGSSVATIWNTMKDLENSALSALQEHHKVPFFPIGPFHIMATSTSSTSILEEDDSCIEWLDKRPPNSVLYISLGSLAGIDDKELTETAWGLANSEQPFLWVVRPGSVKGSRWTEALPEGFEKIVEERGRIVKWAPQKKVLAHPAVAGFFTHCGWNSTLESIWEEVPLICRPFYGDQLVFMRYMTQIYKIGLELEVVERTVIENTIRKLMLGEERNELKKRVVDMKQKIVAGMKIDGSSHKSLNDLVDFISSLPNTRCHGSHEHKTYTTKQEYH